MKITKKLLSLLLAAILLVSTFTMFAYAFTQVPDIVDGNVNYKFSVAKANEAPMADGSATYVGDDIYAVSVYAQASYGLHNITVPIHFNKEHFAPIMIYDGADLYTGYDSYYTDMGEGACYVYSLDGDAWKNIGMYKADGSTATTKALAKCIGLGNPNATEVSVTTDLVSPDHPYYKYYGAGLPSGTGVMFVNLDDTAIAKNAYLNTVDGINFTKEWVKLCTFYFQRNAGVTDADCVGDVFGITTPDAQKVDCVVDTSGYGYFTNVQTVVNYTPPMNIVSNAKVEAGHTTIVDHAKHQIRFQKDADGIYNEMFDIRYLAKIDATTFLNTFGSEEAAKDMISEIGFVFAKHNSIGGADKFDLATAKAMVEQDATAPAGYKKQTVDYLSTTVVPGTYAFSCIVKDIPDAEHDTNGLSAIGYIIYTDKNGDKYTDYYAVGVVSEPFADIYNANTSHIPR